MAEQKRKGGRPRGTGGQAAELTPWEVQAVVRCMAGTRHELRDRTLLYLGLGSGMRVGELVQLRVGDVAPFGQVLDRVVLEKHRTKNRKARTVALSPQAVEQLRLYLRWRRMPPPDAPLFPSQQSRRAPMSKGNALRLLSERFRAAGVANASSHSLRRTHANTLRRMGVDLKVIQQQLGHSTLAVTERYFSVDPLEHVKAVGNLRF